MPPAENGEDDLDAFFEEVEHVVEEEEEKEEGEKGLDPVESTSAPPRPRGVMVAAAASQRSVQTPSISATAPSSHFTSHSLPVVGPTLPPPTNLPSESNLALTPVSATAVASTKGEKRPHVRQAAGKVWVDPTLADWPDNDFRIFVGNLDPTVTDLQLHQHFAKYASLQQVRVIRDMKKKQQPSLGYGFVSLGDPLECAQALREMDQSWLGGRPIRIKRSHWKDRELQERNKKKKQKR
jgi:RNA recognition motif. (a.k.a. RRM, RBD, or RNP domain)